MTLMIQGENIRNELKVTFVPKRSVIAKAERVSPFSNGMSHFSCCSGDPYLARTSKLL